MRIKKKVMQVIDGCDECPNFIHTFDVKIGFCTLTSKQLDHDKTRSYKIPDDCPLEDDSETDI